MWKRSQKSDVRLQQAAIHGSISSKSNVYVSKPPEKKLDKKQPLSRHNIRFDRRLRSRNPQHKIRIHHRTSKGRSERLHDKPKENPGNRRRGDGRNRSDGQVRLQVLPKVLLQEDQIGPLLRQTDEKGPKPSPFRINLNCTRNSFGCFLT